MPVTIQIDPFSIVINSAALLVAIVQLCIVWGQREHRIHDVVDNNEFDVPVRGNRSRDACVLYILIQCRRISILAPLFIN